MPSFFFNDTATTEIYTLSLHDALPICIHCTSAWRSCCCTSSGSRTAGTAGGSSQSCRWHLARRCGSVSLLVHIVRPRGEVGHGHPVLRFCHPERRHSALLDTHGQRHHQCHLQ